MNELNMLNDIKKSQESGASLDFADLLKRIKADGGQSTSPCTMHGGNAVKFVGAAAGIVAVAAISVTALAGISGGMSYSSDMAAPMEPSAPAEAPDMMVSDEEYIYAETVGGENMSDAFADEAPEVDEEITSDSDVSDSDVSGSDVQEVE